MFPEPTELLSIGCSIESIWIPKSKSNTSTPKTNSQTFYPKEISHVMSGTICWACLILVISVLQFALLPWQSELNKNQEKNESQQNQDLWWILLRGCHRSCRLQLHEARGRDGTEIMIFGNLFVVDDRSGQPDRLSPNRLFKIGLSSILGLLKTGKVRKTTHDRSGKLDKTSWNAVQQICPHHGDALFNGNAHSVRYGEIIHDGSGQSESATS